MGKRVIPCGTGAIQEMWARINQHLSGKKTRLWWNTEQYGCSTEVQNQDLWRGNAAQLKHRYVGRTGRLEAVLVGRTMRWIRSRLQGKFYMNCLPLHCGTPQNVYSFLPMICFLSTMDGLCQACWHSNTSTAPHIQLSPWTMEKNLKWFHIFRLNLGS